MTDWPRVRLETIAVDVQPGFACQPTDDPSGIPQLRTNNVSPLGGIDLSETKRVPANDARIKRYSLKPGDVLFNNTNSPALVGKTALFDDDGLFLFSNHMTRIRLAIDIAEPGYVAHYLHWVWKRGIHRGLITQWVNQAAINRRQLSAIQLPLPSLAEQRRIAEILDQADGLRRLRAEADSKASHILPAIFLKMFGDPATNPKGWDTKPFREILTESPRNGLSPSSAGILHAKVLTLSAITGTKFDETAVKDSQFESLSSGNKKVDCRDFLVCRGNGNLGLMGRARFPHRTLSDTLFPDTIIAARVNPKQVDRSYLEALWQTKWMRLQIESRSTTTSGIHKINQATLGSLPVRLPPLPLQIRFGSLSSRLRHGVEASPTRALDRLFDSLSHRAFSGELTN